MPSKDLQKKIEYFFSPYNKVSNFGKHMDFREDQASEKLNMLTRIYEEGMGLKSKDRQTIMKKIQAIKNGTDESLKSKWGSIFNMVFKMDKDRREELMVQLWRFQGGHKVRKHKMKKVKRHHLENVNKQFGSQSSPINH